MSESKVYVVLEQKGVLLYLYKEHNKKQCEELMEQAWQELTQAKLSSVSGAWQLTKASKFLAQARVKYETDRFELCIEKVETARELIAELED